jgi:hypothetical protein
MGIAKGILGVALKPAVGVFDLASRATEGIRGSAIGVNELYSREGIERSRIPRAFGRNGILQSFSLESAAAQYAADKLGDFKRDPRIVVCNHLHINRKLISISSNAIHIDKIFAMNKNDDGFKDLVNHYESWGMVVGNTSLFFLSL